MQLPSLLLGIDPGISTGIALIDCTNRAVIDSATLLECNALGVSDWVLNRFRNSFYFAYCLEELPISTIIEDYHGGVGGKLQNTVNQIIGAAAATMRILGNPVVLQENLKRTPWLTEAQRILNELEIKHTRHQIDALAHALSYSNLEKGLKWSRAASAKNHV